MALRRDIDEYLSYSFEELVELVVSQLETVELLHERLEAMEDVILDKEQIIESQKKLIDAAFAPSEMDD